MEGEAPPAKGNATISIYFLVFVTLFDYSIANRAKKANRSQKAKKAKKPTEAKKLIEANRSQKPTEAGKGKMARKKHHLLRNMLLMSLVQIRTMTIGRYRSGLCRKQLRSCHNMAPDWQIALTKGCISSFDSDVLPLFATGFAKQKFCQSSAPFQRCLQAGILGSSFSLSSGCCNTLQLLFIPTKS